MKTDEALKRDVAAGLEADPAVRSSAIGVTVKDGVVTLSGHLDTYAQKRAAREAVERVEGVRAVALEVDVIAAPDHRRSDTEIAAGAEDVIRFDTVIDPTHVRLTVDGGWLTIEGNVAWDYQRRAIEEALRPIAGVRGITNDVKVRAHPVTADVAARIEDALKRQAIRETQHIDVAVTGSTVKLRGTVHSRQERDAAQNAAWSAPGVEAVVNELQVR